MKTKKSIKRGFIFFDELPFEEKRYYFIGREDYAMSILSKDYITKRDLDEERKGRSDDEYLRKHPEQI